MTRRNTRPRATPVVRSTSTATIASRAQSRAGFGTPGFTIEAELVDQPGRGRPGSPPRSRAAAPEDGLAWVRSETWQRARSRHSAPTTSAACCDRRAARRPREVPAAGPSTRRAARGRGHGDPPTSSPLQEEVGLRSATDGEFRRTSWHMDFIYQLGGISTDRREDGGALAQRRGRRSTSPRPAWGRTTGSRSSTRSSATRSATCREVDRRPAEAHHPVAEHGPLPRRPRGHRRESTRTSSSSGTTSRRVRRQVRRSASSAAPTSSSTTPASPTSTTPSSGRARRPGRGRRAPARALHPPDQRRDRRPPRGHAVTTHMCRGNYRSSWAAEGGYDFVAEALFSELDVDGFFLSTTTSAPAGSSRCGSCPGASRWCSAW